MQIAFAHDVYDRVPDGIFELKWDYDPTLIFFAFLLIFYIRSLFLFKGKKPVKNWQVVMFLLGVFVNILALSPPIDPLSDQLFWAHMVQHLMITHIGVPFMLFGAPFFVIIRGVPNWFRKRVYFPILKSRFLSLINNTIGRPLPALFLFEANYWLWHMPRFYNLALLNDLYHLVEHGSFAIISLLWWKNIIDPKPLPKAHWSLPPRILLLGFMMALNVTLSAWLTFQEEVIYAYEGIPMPTWFARWGHLHDQRLGGLIMWVPGGLVNLLAISAVFFVWAGKEQEKDRLMLEELRAQEQS